jgi:hypothetical protein
MKKCLVTTAAIAAILFLVSCADDAEKGSEEKILAEASKTSKVQISKEVFDEMIQSLPQPIEIANIITKAKMPFSKNMLVPSDYSEKYADKYGQALAFGAYGVDMGYINLNDKKIYVIEYLEAIKNVAAELKVDQFFDFQTLMELTKNRHNADSLIHISTKNFNRIDEALREENRGELSVLMLIGSWTEGLHMFGELYKKEPTDDMLKRIGEQKIVFENIMVILVKLDEIKYFSEMRENIKPLKAAFDQVKISYEYHEPETKEVNGELVIIDKTETKVTVTPETAAEIIKSLEAFRKKNLLTF